MKKGIGIFGKQYEIMHMNNTHANGSVDMILSEQMIKLDITTVEYLYSSYTDLFSHYKSGSRLFLEKIVDGLKSTDQSETVDNIIKYCRNIVDNTNVEMNDMIFGGTEEEIIQRGTDWCTDISRVACVMFQITGLPSRIIVTANTRYAYCGHVVTEVYYKNKWGIADPTNGTVIKEQNGNPVSAWEIHNSFNDEQYESVGISNYYIDEKELYNYETSGLNDYYREILLHSAEQWAGSIRWIHGEDLL